MPLPVITNLRSIQFLKTSVNIWFVLVVLGQFIFSLYILGLYGVSGIAGDFERWNSAAPHGYIQKDFLGNLFFGLHVLLAAVITIGGPLQLMKKVRNNFPKFHRINGRIYVFSAFLIGIAGFYLTWVRGSVGGLIGSVFISINGVLIFICAFYTIKKAINHQFTEHRRWAIRLFLAMSGVWFFRVFLMLWLTIHQAPVGFDMDTFQGPALNMLYIFSYILPFVSAEFYFRIKDSPKTISKLVLSIFLLLLTSCIVVGTFSATMGMWFPRL
ncbi:MAG: DUF2306 domain-containing protein [Flammeovirgaceae bacterium]|nr:DUF2306 domain-containing protein [Flammeovirgaceae bacterium]